LLAFIVVVISVEILWKCPLPCPDSSTSTLNVKLGVQAIEIKHSAKGEISRALGGVLSRLQELGSADREGYFCHAGIDKNGKDYYLLDKDIDISQLSISYWLGDDALPTADGLDASDHNWSRNDMTKETEQESLLNPLYAHIELEIRLPKTLLESKPSSDVVDRSNSQASGRQSISVMAHAQIHHLEVSTSLRSFQVLRAWQSFSKYQSSKPRFTVTDWERPKHIVSKWLVYNLSEKEIDWTECDNDIEDDDDDDSDLDFDVSADDTDFGSTYMCSQRLKLSQLHREFSANWRLLRRGMDEASLSDTNLFSQSSRTFATSAAQLRNSLTAKAAARTSSKSSPLGKLSLSTSRIGSRNSGLNESVRGGSIHKLKFLPRLDNSGAQFQLHPRLRARFHWRIALFSVLFLIRTQASSIHLNSADISISSPVFDPVNSSREMGDGNVIASSRISVKYAQSVPLSLRKQVKTMCGRYIVLYDKHMQYRVCNKIFQGQSFCDTVGLEPEEFAELQYLENRLSVTMLEKCRNYVIESIKSNSQTSWSDLYKLLTGKVSEQTRADSSSGAVPPGAVLKEDKSATALLKLLPTSAEKSSTDESSMFDDYSVVCEAKLKVGRTTFSLFSEVLLTDTDAGASSNLSGIGKSTISSASKGRRNLRTSKHGALLSQSLQQAAVASRIVSTTKLLVSAVLKDFHIWGQYQPDTRLSLNASLSGWRVFDVDGNTFAYSKECVLDIGNTNGFQQPAKPSSTLGITKTVNDQALLVGVLFSLNSDVSEDDEIDEDFPAEAEVAAHSSRSTVKTSQKSPAPKKEETEPATRNEVVQARFIILVGHVDLSLNIKFMTTMLNAVNSMNSDVHVTEDIMRASTILFSVYRASDRNPIIDGYSLDCARIVQSIDEFNIGNGKDSFRSSSLSGRNSVGGSTPSSGRSRSDSNRSPFGRKASFYAQPVAIPEAPAQEGKRYHLLRYISVVM
jgi:hypothetical protein